MELRTCARRSPLGYGVHIALLGHDLHGLRIGPDGRLYFSVGDRGFDVKTESGRIAHAQSGAVLRCELDGSKLEMFHTGLRNPQELAFDEFGNLFTGDSGSGAGGEARFVQLVEGGDSGWRYAYQWIESPVSHGPWSEESLWKPHFAGQAAFLLPPIANLASAPLGLTYSPGTGLPERYDRHFFLSDLAGTRASSGIHAFDLGAAGAGFELGAVEPFVWGALPTDCDFGPDGALWFSDWASGREKSGKGRIYRVFAARASATAEAKSTRSLLAGGMQDFTPPELLELLGHRDQRVRQEAQFELVERGGQGVGPLSVAALRGPTLFARLHGIWGVGTLARVGTGAVDRLLPLLADSEPEVRAQVAGLLGEHGVAAAFDALAALVADGNYPRVQMFAAMGLGKLGDERAVSILSELLRRTGESDPVLRHAAVQGLVGCASVERLVALNRDPSPFVRLGAVVALRALGEVRIDRFLVDSDPRVVREAARAIHDGPVWDALPTLAYLLASTLREDPPPERWAGRAALPLFIARVEGTEDGIFLRRVLNANYRLGREIHAWRLAEFSTRDAASPALRAEALRMLIEWETPSVIDRVGGEYRDLGTRAVGFLPAIEEWLAAWLEKRDSASAPPEVVVEQMRLLFAD